ncbi:MAG: hypothetical protein M3Q42_08435 [Pseudomonadota bacterium]|nr:hypothetical protein [Pseudomonadota bacterium]
MRFKSTTFALAAAIAAMTTAGVASAQSYSINWNPRSGDVWVDAQLQDVNRYGSRYREPFVNEMVRYYGAPRELVTELLGTRNWAPGDVYYACALAEIIGRPCRYVVDEWERDHGQGWGELAKRMGIKPGSPEFHRLKRGFVPTYDRWARPIRIDDDLARDFPGRDRGRQMRDDGPGNSAKSGNDKGKGNKGQGRGNDKDKGKGDKDKGKGDKGNGNGKGGKGNGKG